MRKRTPSSAGGMLPALAIILMGTPGLAQDAPPAPPPGFRPPSPQATAFVASLPDARIVVLPTAVRTPQGAVLSSTSQQSIVDLLNEGGFAVATADPRGVELGAAPHVSQWELFHRSLATLATALPERSGVGDYGLMMELVLPPGPPRVFGIETYVLDREGRNAFSFLLNAHHPRFVDAGLVAADDTPAAREAMIARATRLGVEALEEQVRHARACAEWMAAHPARQVPGGVIEDFDAGLPALRDAHGVPLGFSTFDDGHSTARIATTADHPPRPGEAPGNRVLQIDFDVQGWAGFTYLIHDAPSRGWRSQDWTPFEGIRFWMYGRATGARFYVHVFDNRSPCSTVDDAERFGFEFTDDFSGWEQVVIPFRDMVRAEIGNGAPDDGFGRNRVYGWAVGATDTPGPGTWYLDDVALWPGDARDPR